jgi:ABC-type multidrug transport system ATPase subunit
MLEISHLTKRYGSGGGISDVSFSVPAGSVAAVVGPNGAGKSTLFNILSGVQPQGDGTCVLDGVELKKLKPDEVGFMPEKSYLIPDFTPVQMLMYVNQMREILLSDDEIEKLISLYDLGEFRNKKNKALSQGMSRRVALVCALMGSPRLLILDEPTNGLDTQSVILLKEALKQHKKRGAVILISSHVLDFLDSIADEILFLKDGELIRVGKKTSTEIEKMYIELFIPKEKRSEL